MLDDRMPFGQYVLAAENREKVRAYFATHLCATQRDCSLALGVGEDVVRRHFRAIRAEWCQNANPNDREAAEREGRI